MKNPALKILLFGLILASNTSFATSPADTAKRLGASDMTEVRFDKSSTELKGAELKHLKEALNEASKNGKVNGIKLLVWSDKEYPPENKKQTEKDVKLANDRLAALKKQVKKDLKVMDVGTYNMAEHTSALEKLFATQDAQVKGSGDTADLKGYASHAVVLIFTEKK